MLVYVVRMTEKPEVIARLKHVIEARGYKFVERGPQYIIPQSGAPGYSTREAGKQALVEHLEKVKMYENVERDHDFYLVRRRIDTQEWTEAMWVAGEWVEEVE